MSYQGVHFAITDQDLSALRSLPVEADRVDYVSNVIEKAWDDNFATQSDKAWALIHSALQMSNPCSDDLEKAIDAPASWAILGAEDLALTTDAMVVHVDKSRVGDVARYLEGVSASEIRSRLCRLIEKHQCDRLSPEEADYAAEWYPGIAELYARAASAGRHVIFSADLV
jgi:hypothetical protein